MKRALFILALVALSVGGLWTAWYARHRAVTLPAQPQPQTAPVEVRVPFLDAQPTGLLPDDPVWQEIQSHSVPLLYQVLAIPWGKSDKGPMEVRSFHNGEKVFVRLEWADPTQDRGGARVEETPDAAAVMFLLEDTEETSSLMMGFLGRANIWHWKANWDTEVWAHYSPSSSPGTADWYPFETDSTFYPAQAAGNLRATPMRASAVEDILSEGPGSITAKQEQVVQGRGLWLANRWAVVLERALTTLHADDFQFRPQRKAQMALAAWDGSRGEKGSRKSISEWVWLTLESPPRRLAGGNP